jgi:protein-arginine kinase activator protein McsA
MTPLEKLKERLQKAVEEERYEDAAGLRDEIRRLEQSQTSN